jgi:(R,R)-butanediol dehydrogenase/meso-butanediol dehydrogenase/diacetyl reductase
VGIHSVRRANLKPGDTVVLLGVGAIGSFICSALTGHDGPVIAIDIDESRLDVARTLGASQTLLIPPDITAQGIRDLLPAGAHVVFETSGVLGGAERAFALAARGGDVVLVGLNKTLQPLNLADIVLREVNVQTTVAHVCGQDMPAALELLERSDLAASIVGEVVPLDDVVASGLEPLVGGTAGGKLLVDPRRG